MVVPKNSTYLQPEFSPLSNPSVIKEHMEGLITTEESILHDQILGQLLEEIEPVDFIRKAYPDEVEKLYRELDNYDYGCAEYMEIYKEINSKKVSTKQYRILTIDEIVAVASKKRWDICMKNSFIYIYNRAYWAEIDKEAFQKFLGDAAERMNVKWDNYKDYRFRNELFKQFLATASLPMLQNNKNVVLINLQNGTFEINAGKTQLRPFQKDDFLTYQLPFKYDEKAKAPIFQSYLDRVLPDVESQKVLAEFLWSVFIKHGGSSFKEEKALILYGSGANGKSVFFDIVNALVDAVNISNFSLQSLTNENGYYRAKIANKLVNYASEINSNLETSIFKQLVSGEPVEARLPYGEPFTLKEYAKLIFNCNELPKTVEHTEAFFRRFLIIPFNVTIPEEEQDKELSSKIIKQELSGVFNWVLEGLNRILSQKRFSECKAAQEAVKQYQSNSENIRLFLEEFAYITSTSEYIKMKDLFSQYKNFCIDSGLRFCGIQNFKKRLEEMKIPVRQNMLGNIVYVQKKQE